MMTKEQRARHMRELTSALARAARRMRDVSANMAGDDEFGEAWQKLNGALVERDDFIEHSMRESLAELETVRAAFPYMDLPARLDLEGTAKGKTILTAPVVEGGCLEGTMHAGPASTHVDTETGIRTPLLPASMERVTFGPTPHIWFDKTNRILHCDRCPDEEALDETSAEIHIQLYAAAHSHLVLNHLTRRRST